MATLSSGDTLSLNNLATATDQSTKSMGTVAGSTATPIIPLSPCTINYEENMP